MAAELGEKEAVSMLAEIYRKGEMVKRDAGESERMIRSFWVDANSKKSDDGLECGIEQTTKAIFIRGNGGINEVVPCEESKDSIKHLTFFDGVESIGRHALAHCDGLERVVLSSSATRIDPWTFLEGKKFHSINISELNK